MKRRVLSRLGTGWASCLQSEGGMATFAGMKPEVEDTGIVSTVNRECVVGPCNYGAFGPLSERLVGNGCDE